MTRGRQKAEERRERRAREAARGQYIGEINAITYALHTSNDAHARLARSVQSAATTMNDGGSFKAIYAAPCDAFRFDVDRPEPPSSVYGEVWQREFKTMAVQFRVGPMPEYPQATRAAKVAHMHLMLAQQAAKCVDLIDAEEKTKGAPNAR